LRSRQKRSRRLRLLGGLMVCLSTFYCPPVADAASRRRAADGSGLYPHLCVLGFDDGSSAALVSRVARACVLSCSFEQARRELADDGLALKIKVVHRISSRLAAQALTRRNRNLVRFAKKELPQGDELAGKRVGVAIDGGRVRLRKSKEAKRKIKGGSKKRRRKFDASWREPKVFIIFEIGPDGRMAKKSKAFIDGTFGGPDEAMELLAMYLHSLGAAKALEVVFLADGAPWAWERAEKTLLRAGIDKKKARYVLDFWHAAGQLSKALSAAKMSEADHARWFKKLRGILKKGKAREVVRRLRAIGDDRLKREEMETHIEYLNKHSLAGRMNYGLLKEKKLPLGSGAIESAIRRVVNLRLKGCGLMWLEKNAEGLLGLRAAALTGRWDDLLLAIRLEMHQDGVLDPGPDSREPPVDPPAKEPRLPRPSSKSQPPSNKTVKNKLT
jgi:hypothetical protein